MLHSSPISNAHSLSLFNSINLKHFLVKLSINFSLKLSIIFLLFLIRNWLLFNSSLFILAQGSRLNRHPHRQSDQMFKLFLQCLGHLQGSKFALRSTYICRSKFLPYSNEICKNRPEEFKFWQSGEFLPNQVTLPRHVVQTKVFLCILHFYKESMLSPIL